MSDGEAALVLDEKAVRAMIAEFIHELAPASTGAAVSLDDRLIEDLNYNSLALMELAFTIEDEFELDPVSEEDLLEISTVLDVLNYVVHELRLKGEFL